LKSIYLHNFSKKRYNTEKNFLKKWEYFSERNYLYIFVEKKETGKEKVSLIKITL